MIIVTGASRGLGKAICERLSASGNEVLGLARSEVQAPYATRTCDVTRFDDLRALAGELRQEGAVEALINVAGVASMNLAITTPETTVRQIVETNLLGTIFACQAFAPLMLRHKMGRIVNFSTIAVALGLKGESIYAASKAGIEGFSRAFAREMADFGITVNCIAPGPIDTDLLRGVSQEQIARIIEHQIVPKQFAPSAVCDLVETLLSPKAQMLTGQVLHVGGV